MDMITHYRLEDDRVWSIAQAAFVVELPDDAVIGPCPDEQGNSSIKGLIGCLKFYGYAMGELTPPEGIQAMLTTAIQQRLDSFAQTRGYDGIMSACSYFGSSNPRFKAEADRAIALRDATWAKCYEILDDVLAGRRPVPTAEELFAELPALAWEDDIVDALLAGQYSQ